jgi:hypothetical protein
METLQWEPAVAYEYCGPVVSFCSSGGEVGATDEALQQSQAAMTNTLNSDYSTTFAEQQQVAKQQMAVANNLIANPMGYSPQFMAQQTTAINENAATGARQALGSAAAFAASHGGAADVGGGGAAQLAGQIGSAAATSKAQQLSALATSNQQTKLDSFYKGIGELNNAGSNLEGVGGTAIGGAGTAANSSVGAGSGALAAQQAGWQDVGGIISGVAGLATAASGFKMGGGAALSQAGGMAELEGASYSGGQETSDNYGVGQTLEQG